MRSFYIPGIGSRGLTTNRIQPFEEPLKLKNRKESCSWQS